MTATKAHVDRARMPDKARMPKAGLPLLAWKRRASQAQRPSLSTPPARRPRRSTRITTAHRTGGPNADSRFWRPMH